MSSLRRPCKSLSAGRLGRCPIWVPAALGVAILTGFVQPRVGAEQQATTSPGALTSLPIEYQEPNLDGKLRAAERALKAQDYVGAVTPAMAAIRQAVAELKPGDPVTTATLDRVVLFIINLANEAKAAERFEVAQHCYAQIHGMYKDRADAQLGLADIARLSGRPWEAYELYMAYLKLTNRPRDHKGDLGMGLTCLALNQSSQAVHYLRAAVKLAPNNAEAQMGLARALLGEKKSKEAVDIARKAIQLDDLEPPEKRHREYRYYLAIILREAQLTEECIAVTRELADTVRAAVKANPADPKYVDELDRVLGLRYQLLENQSRTEQGSRDPRIFLDLAQVIEEQGKLQQVHSCFRAMEQLQIIRQLQPDNVSILLQLGRLSRFVGDVEGAVRAYQAVIRTTPGDNDAKEALRAMGAPLIPAEPASTAPTTAPASKPTTSAP